MKKLIAFLFALSLASPAHAVICGSVPFTLQAGQTASASQVMANFNAITTCVNANAAANGANSDITSLSGLTTPLSPAQGGTSNYYATAVSSTANALLITTIVPNNFTLAAGKIVTFLSTVSNTASTTLNTMSTGATALYRATASAGMALLGGGEIVNGGLYTVMYDGARYILLNPSVTDDPGVIKDFGGSTAPAGWQLAYGQVVSQTTYAALYTAIGTTWDTGGEGAGNFRLPDLRGRLVAGKDNMGGSAASRLTAASGCTGTTLGNTCGDELQQSHTHTFSGTTNATAVTPTFSPAYAVGGQAAAISPGSGTYADPNTSHTHTFSGTTSSTGSGSAQNVQPTAIVNKIIRN